MNDLVENDLAKRLIDGDESVPLTYEEARSLADHQDVGVRLALANHGGLPPEILYFLSLDEDPEVRRAAVVNPSTPPKAHLRLASDSDAGVRTDLAEQIARIAPGLCAEDQDTACQTLCDALAILAQDEVVRVRGILSDVLKDVTNAPSETIKQLALDAEIIVSGPVLENSPVLTDNDLLEIIRIGPAKGGVGAISRRANVTEKVADAVVETSDVEAIADLLGNSSAQIREETLDSLVNRAPDIELWHSPLVGRPTLPPKAVKKLAGFVASNLLSVLEARSDLDDETMGAVKEVVQRRIAGNSMDADNNAAATKSHKEDFLEENLPMEMAVKLQSAGKLNNKVLINAVQADDFGLVLAALVIRGDVEEGMVKNVFAAKSAKGVVALAWKAELSMELAVLMQQRMARIAPTDILSGKEGGFPLNEEDMAWQLEFFGSQLSTSFGNLSDNAE